MKLSELDGSGVPLCCYHQMLAFLACKKNKKKNSSCNDEINLSVENF
jgi:hypothetical protein